MPEVVTGSVCYVVLCHVSFSASIRLMICSLKIVLLIPFKISHGKPELQTTIINIITSKLRGPYLPLFSGRKSSGLGGSVDSVKFGTPCHGGQSSHKLIPHIICQSYMHEEKTLDEVLFYKGSSASLPRLHRCENKVPFWDFKEFAVTKPNQTRLMSFSRMTVWY